MVESTLLRSSGLLAASREVSTANEAISSMMPPQWAGKELESTRYLGCRSNTLIIFVEGLRYIVLTTTCTRTTSRYSLCVYVWLSDHHHIITSSTTTLFRNKRFMLDEKTYCETTYFKICHIFAVWNTLWYRISFFILCYFIFSPLIECPCKYMSTFTRALILGKNKVVYQWMINKKNIWVFIFPK